MDSVKKERFILRSIKFFPALVILLSSIFITSYISSDYSANFKKEKIEIKNEFVKSNKDRIKINIDSISKLINTKTINAKEELKKDLQHNIDVAHDIAINIYNKNKNKLSKEEIILHIKNSLEALRFDNGEGYFSIHTIEGINILQPIHREFEGTSLINKKDAVGNYTVKDGINIAKEKGEGFMSWYSTKPSDKSKEYMKVGIVKKFEPYNLVITTGRFLDDYTDQIKNEIIGLLKVIEYQDKGYIFIINDAGDFLLTRSNFSNVKDVKKINAFRDNFYKFQKSKKQDTYLEYEYHRNNHKYLKVSYLKKIPELNWIIATGFDYDNLNLIIDKKQKELEEDYEEHLSIILITSLIITLVFLILSLFVSNLIETMFYEYKRRLLEKETMKFETMMEELNLIFDNLPMNVIYKDTKNNIIRVNKIFADSIDRTVEELRNVPSEDIFPDHAKKYFEYDLEVIKNKKAVTNSIGEYPSKKGLRLIEFSNIPIFDKKGEVKNIIVFVTDITERESLKEDNEKKETLLYQQSKMATMGEMIANIAHQWKQPLSAITVSSTGIKLQKEMDSLSDSELTFALDTITNSAEYLSQTIDDFRNFFNPNSNNYKEFRISSPIKKAFKLLLPKYKTQDIEIIEDIEDIKIVSLENEIIQVLINILNNSRDELVKYKQRRLIFIKTYKKDKSLMLEIKDNGKGIPKDTIDNIFNAYFTTKESTHGTGIGLYMSKSILTKLLNAEIKVENETYIYEDVEYTGAKFTINIHL